jgi:predicted transcriptional regulator
MKSSKKLTLDDFKVFDERAEKGRAIARAIDNKTPIPYSVTILEHNFDEFLANLTPKRYELLRLSKTGGRSITQLAVAAKRDTSSVSKDIAKLVELGLVTVITEPNTGHGVKKIVRRVAENIEIRTIV